MNPLIKEYLSKGFGSMTKNDFEVWIFHHLMQADLKGMSNYEISRKLYIPETKVKRLRYEADLKYSSQQEIESRLYDILNTYLAKAYIKVVGKDVQIQFVVEDLSVRKYLDFKLKKAGFFSDSSFNTEIVSVRSEGLKFLYLSTPQGKRGMEILKKAEKAKKGNDGEGWFTCFLKSVVQGAGEAVGATVVNLSMTYMLGLL